MRQSSSIVGSPDKKVHHTGYKRVGAHKNFEAFVATTRNTKQVLCNNSAPDTLSPTAASLVTAQLNGVHIECNDCSQRKNGVAAWARHRSRTTMTSTSTSTDLNLPFFERAKALIPGGVNSPVRAFKAVAVLRASCNVPRAPILGCQWSALYRLHRLLGPHDPRAQPPGVLEAVQKAALDGFSFGAPTEREIELAEAILRLVPSMEMIRLVSSGTEAGMSAIRLARGATGRSKIIKFNGCYHGHADSLLVKAGSGLPPLVMPPAPVCHPRWCNTPWCSNTTT